MKRKRKKRRNEGKFVDIAADGGGGGWNENFVEEWEKTKQNEKNGKKERKYDGAEEDVGRKNVMGRKEKEKKEKSNEE